MLTIINRINNLPNDIINIIIPYTYNVQNKILLNDIENYVETKNKIIKLNYNYLSSFPHFYNFKDKFSILRTIYTYKRIEHIYKQFVQNLHYKTDDAIDKYIRFILNDANQEMELNIIWGLLSSEERNDIIILFKKSFINNIF